LSWQGPYEWFASGATSIFGGPSAETVGVYVWTVPVAARYRAFYIGQTEQGFAARHHEHFREYWGGAYSFYEPGAFSKGVLVRLYAGYAYKKPRWQHATPFHAAFPQYVEPLVEHLKVMRLWIAECPEPGRIQRRIESSLMGLLYARQDAIGDFLQPGLVRQPRRQDEEPILVRQSSTDIIEGLPAEFEA
jgi:hypothetical protein